LFGADSLRADSALARRLWLAALEREAEMDTDSSTALLRLARAADASFLAAHQHYIGWQRYIERVGVVSVREEYRRIAAASGSPHDRCLAIAAGAPAEYAAAALADLLELDRRTGGTACTTVFLSTMSFDAVPERIWAPRIAAMSEKATRIAPIIAEVWMARSIILRKMQRKDEGRRAILEGLEHSAHALQRLQLYTGLAAAYDDLGDGTRAGEVRRALAAAVERDGRPALRYEFPQHVLFRGPDAGVTNMPAWERMYRDRVRVTAGRGHPRHEWGARRELAVTLSDAGRPAESLVHFDRLVRIADSLDAPLMQGDTRRFRGRAFAKLGRWANAEADLRRSIAIGHEIGNPYLLAEAYHNLAHVYEGMGRLVDASREVERFIEVSRPLEHAQPRVMSLHDAGIIRWKGGWHAASNAAFAKMVQVVDQQERNHYWAGEYYERIGDLQRALHYFRLGESRDRYERSFNLAGKSRVFRALGELDSAEVAARAHDAVMSDQLDVPLLPPLLAARGQRDEAEKIAGAWARRHLEGGNIHGASIATNAFADLLLAWRDDSAAYAEAVAAEQLARRANIKEEIIRALRLQGTASMRLGARERGIARLREAASLVAQHPTTEGTLLTQLALGDGLADAGRPEEALAAYDQAAGAVESVTALLDRDVDRAKYRDRQLAPFSGALRVLLRREPDGRTRDVVARWSQRRKAASLALATGLRPASTAAAARLPLEALRRRLDPRSAVIDYLDVDSNLVALVVRRDAANIVRLPLRSDSIARLTDRLRRPFLQTYDGRLDLARAEFDLDAAGALHAALLAPLDSLLKGVERLTIIPDGPMYSVPFDALISGYGGQPASLGHASFAVDRFQITIAPSLAFQWNASGTTAQSLASARVLAVIGDAPGADREADGIRTAWSSQRLTLLRGDSATESAVQRLGRGAGILHFTTHGVADDRDPLASHLRLAAEAQSDGYLHIGEIAEHRYSARLVVLSACETQTGPSYAGEGLMGIARAFLAGGAESVVATQWPIGAGTAELMREFHSRLATGADAARALHAAKLVLRHDSRYVNPFYWAGFVLVEGAQRSE
jgi:CHAT domain-containing protein/tetratricopeptide (TPR) repeat protein